MRRIFAFALLFAIGCSSDPATSPLKAGQTVLLHDDKEPRVFLSSKSDLIELPVGAKLRVGKAEPDAVTREMQFIVDEGRYQGQPVKAYRSQVRPLD